MLCDKYDKLNHIEKVTFIGELCHAAQSDNEMFELAEGLIALAITKGLFNKVTIMPDSTIPDTKNQA
jgi:hypothetical protein